MQEQHIREDFNCKYMIYSAAGCSTNVSLVQYRANIVNISLRIEWLCLDLLRIRYNILSQD